MKKLKQVGIILFILLLSDLLEKILGIPLPAPIMGMIILTILLVFNIIKLEWIEEGANALITIFAFLFVPTLVSSRDSLHLLKNDLISIIIILIIGTIVVMAVTAFVAQFLNRYFDNKENKDGLK